MTPETCRRGRFPRSSSIWGVQYNTYLYTVPVSRCIIAPALALDLDLVVALVPRASCVAHTPHRGEPLHVAHMTRKHMLGRTQFSCGGETPCISGDSSGHADGEGEPKSEPTPPDHFLHKPMRARGPYRAHPIPYATTMPARVDLAALDIDRGCSVFIRGTTRHEAGRRECFLRTPKTWVANSCHKELARCNHASVFKRTG